MTAALPNPFEVKPAPSPAPNANRFDEYFDPERFLADLEAAPLFLSDPRPEFLRSAQATLEFKPIFDIIQGACRNG